MQNGKKQRHLKMQAEEIIKSAQFENGGKHIKFMSQLLCQWANAMKNYTSELFARPY
jgi:hypothetical protein